MKKFISILLVIILIISCTLLCACKKTISSTTTDTVEKVETVADTNNDETQGQNETKGEETVNYEAKSTDKLIDINGITAPGKEELTKEYQEREPIEGDVVAILSTSMGDIKFRLLYEVAPIACANFVALAKDGRYDGTIFHRVIDKFMIQGGDYTAFNGTGGASAYGEEFDLEVDDNIGNIEGSVAMANRGPGTNGSQFYINQVDNDYLNGGYTVFGQVYEGQEIVNDIAAVSTDANDKPLTDVILESVTIDEYK